MTPAENPKAPERNLGFAPLEKKAKVLPIPVANPAPRVKVKANATDVFSMFYLDSQ
jgi:hypothetical protein